MHVYQSIKRRLNFLERITQATYTELFALWITLNTSFAVLYFLLATYHPLHGPTSIAGLLWPERLSNSFYFSLVTGTSLGYGDIVPLGFSKVLAMLQVSLALMIFAVFVTKLVSRRHEIAINEVYRMTFEGIFYHIRQGLFVVRKDFDALMHHVRHHGTLTPREWETLKTSFLQAQSLIEEIPELYEGQYHNLYSIDPKRERLLFEAIQRTLQRIDALLLTFQQHNVNWLDHEETTRELHALLQIIDNIMPLWRERSPYHRVEEFEDIFHLGEQLHTRIKGTLKRAMEEAAPDAEAAKGGIACK